MSDDTKASQPAARQTTTASDRRTPAFGIAIVVGLLVFGYAMLHLPFEGDPKTEHRLGTGCIALLVGMLIYGGARSTVESVLKALVEVIAVGLFLLNGLAAALVWMWKQPLTDFAIEIGFSEKQTFGQVVIVLAIAAFVVNAVVFVLLHPLSRIVGTKLEIE